MSAETAAAVEDAIRAHVTDEGDGDTRLLTDWYLVTASVSDDVELTHYLHLRSDSPIHVHLGLTDVAYRRIRSEFDHVD